MFTLNRVLTKGTSAEVQISMRQAAFSGPVSRCTAIPLEPFSTNKEMGRILIRRGGETIAAGECLLYMLHSPKLIDTQELCWRSLDDGEAFLASRKELARYCSYVHCDCMARVFGGTV